MRINLGNTPLFRGMTVPDICPVCSHPQSYFEIHAENY